MTVQLGDLSKSPRWALVGLGWAVSMMGRLDPLLFLPRKECSQRWSLSGKAIVVSRRTNGRAEMLQIGWCALRLARIGLLFCCHSWFRGLSDIYLLVEVAVSPLTPKLRQPRQLRHVPHDPVRHTPPDRPPAGPAEHADVEADARRAAHGEVVHGVPHHRHLLQPAAPSRQKPSTMRGSGLAPWPELQPARNSRKGRARRAAASEASMPALRIVGGEPQAAARALAARRASRARPRSARNAPRLLRRRCARSPPPARLPRPTSGCAAKACAMSRKAPAASGAPGVTRSVSGSCPPSRNSSPARRSLPPAAHSAARRLIGTQVAQ